MVLPFLSFFEKLSLRNRAVIVSVRIFAASMVLYWQTGGHELFILTMIFMCSRIRM